MTLHLTIPPAQHTDFHPRITVIGVGGGGTNAVDNMIAMGLEGVEFVVANTDAQTLQKSRADRRVQLGPHLTQGLGAGAKPEIGRAAAEEATEELARHLEGTHMVFVTAGMGGGTGTGAAPVVARMARERGVLTVGVVTKPFDFEGRKRQRAAEAGIEELQGVVDTLIVIPNQNLFRQANERTTVAEAFQMADKVLYDGVRGVTELMVRPGKVNLDFADIRTVMAEMGKAMMGTGEAEGEDRAARAAELAISNPLLDDSSLRGAKSMLINIMGGEDVTLFEVEEAVNRIRKEVDEDANIIFGTSLDETMNGRIVISVVATGIDVEVGAREAERPRLVATGGQPPAGGPVRAYPAPPAPAPQGQHAGYPGQNPGFPGAGFQPGGFAPAQRPAAAPPGAHAPHAPAPQHAPPAPRPAPPAETEAAPFPALAHDAARAAPLPAPAARPAPPAAGPRRPGLFNTVTGLIRGNLQQPPPVEPPAPPRPPVLVTEPAGPGPRQAAGEGTDYEIPSFLRRQGN